MIAVQSQVATCDLAICRATGECRGYPWRCAQVDQQQAERPAELRERLPASEIGT